jgi:hypothetical protein
MMLTRPPLRRHDTGVISSGELETIRVRVGEHSTYEALKKKERDLLLKDRSLQRIRQWPNTIYTLKAQKEQLRY